MNLIKHLKPDVSKIVIAILVAGICAIVLPTPVSTRIVGCMGGITDCAIIEKDYSQYALVKDCCGISLSELIIQYLQFIILPFIVTYILIALAQIEAVRKSSH